MELLDRYNELRADVFAYFGYVEDWRILPLDDARDFYWRLDGDGFDGRVRFAETEDCLNNDEEGQFYEDEIYTNRHLPKWVYRGPEYTMIVVDTRTDGNQLLRVFDNDKERP